MGVTVRRCPFPGCKLPAKAKGTWCGDAHRVAGFKLKAQTGTELPRERKRTVDAAAKRTAREQGVIASDVRLSYARAVRVCADQLVRCGLTTEDGAAQVASELLAPALPERLRPERAGVGRG